MSDELQRKLAHQVEIKKMQEKINRMRQLVPIDGFHRAYFLLLKDSTTNVEAFNKLNDEYFELFGVYRYGSWDYFRNAMKRKNQK